MCTGVCVHVCQVEEVFEVERVMDRRVTDRGTEYLLVTKLCVNEIEKEKLDNDEPTKTFTIA